MLDTHARKYVFKFIDFGVRFFEKNKWTPNKVTLLSFIIGMTTGIWIMLGNITMAIITLWFSGYLDAVDGALARKLNQSSKWGTLIDITFDRLVEISVILGFAFYDTSRTFYLLFMTTSIIFSMTIFLTVGSLTNKESQKSFYYQAGIMERSEGFVMFTLMILLPNHFVALASLYTGLVYFTGGQRLLEARDLLE